MENLDTLITDFKSKLEKGVVPIVTFDDAEGENIYITTAGLGIIVEGCPEIMYDLTGCVNPRDWQSYMTALIGSLVERTKSTNTNFIPRLDWCEEHIGPDKNNYLLSLEEADLRGTEILCALYDKKKYSMIQLFMTAIPDIMH